MLAHIVAEIHAPDLAVGDVCAGCWLGWLRVVVGMKFCGLDLPTTTTLEMPMICLVTKVGQYLMHMRACL